MLALPLAVTDEIQGGMQPCMFFPPQRSKVPRRRLVSELFQVRLDSGLTVLPGVLDGAAGQRDSRGGRSAHAQHCSILFRHTVGYGQLLPDRVE